jgi:hypothetical protein
MTMSYEVDRERRRLVTVWQGDVTLQDVLQHLEHRAREGTLGFAQLIDATKACVAFTSKEAERIANAMKMYARKIRLGSTAILARKDVDFGMYRLFGTVADEAYAVNVFRSGEPARQWLGWTSEEAAVRAVSRVTYRSGD